MCLAVEMNQASSSVLTLAGERPSATQTMKLELFAQVRIVLYNAIWHDTNNFNRRNI